MRRACEVGAAAGGRLHPKPKTFTSAEDALIAELVTQYTGARYGLWNYVLMKFHAGDGGKRNTQTAVEMRNRYIDSIGPAIDHPAFSQPKRQR
jgi:hypothetical protein